MPLNSNPCRIRKIIFLLTLLVLWPITVFGSTADSDFKSPVHVINRTNTEAESFPVSGGIPFPAGHLYDKDIGQLSIQDDSGKPVAAQFKPFVYWWGKDGSVKWLLIDVLSDVKPGRTTRYFITKNKNKGPKSPVSAKVHGDKIVVYTGRLKAVISRERGTLLETVHIDLDNDKKFEPDERVIEPDYSNGVHVISDSQEIVKGSTDLYNMWGYGSGRISEYQKAGKLVEHPYLSGLGKPDRVEIESNGPVRATVLIQGKHFPRAEKGIRGIKKGFYYYTTRLHFFSGQTFVRIEHSIDNNRSDFPLHMYAIKELKLHFNLDLGKGSTIRYEIGGENNAIKGSLTGENIGLFQDSANRERWNLYPLLQDKSEQARKNVPGYFYQAHWKIGPAKFRGYRIGGSSVVMSPESALESGDHAPGWAALYGEAGGISVHVNRFWEECPKALILGKKSLGIVLFPGFSPEEFQLHPGTRKNHTIFLNFHDLNSGQTEQRSIADLFKYTPLLKSDAKMYATSLALPRAMGIGKQKQKQTGKHWYPHANRDKKIITARWKTLGLQAGFNAGGMHPNYWTLFDDYVQNNDTFSYEKGVVYAKWASESIPWLIHDYALSPENSHLHHRLVGYGRKVLFANRKSSDIRRWLNPYISNIPGFSSDGKFHLDGEHLIHLWPFEWYLLTGSPIARDGLNGLANQAKYSIDRNFFKHRQPDSA